MSAHRTRGILRAAALLAVGASPLLTGAASAADQPLDLVEGKVGDAPKVDAGVTKQATDLLDTNTVRLPSAALPKATAELDAPALPVAAPALPATGDLPVTLPGGVSVPDATKPAPGGVTPGGVAPGVDLPNVQKPVLPSLPDVGKPPVDATPHVG